MCILHGRDFVMNRGVASTEVMKTWLTSRSSIKVHVFCVLNIIEEQVEEKKKSKESQRRQRVSSGSKSRCGGGGTVLPEYVPR